MLRGILLTQKLVSLAMYIEDLYILILAKVLTQFCYIYIHAPGVEVVVINPDSLKGKIALEHLILVTT